MKKILSALAFTSLLAIGGCSPEVGSPEWCTDMKEKPKSDWSSNEAADYTKNCLF